MKRILMPVLAAGMLAAPAAFGAAVIVYDADLGEEFEVEREIVEIAKEVYGEAAIYATGDEISEELVEELAPKQMLPADAAVEDLPEELAGRLPHTSEGTRWVKVGDHLVEVNDDNMIVMTIYDVLP